MTDRIVLSERTVAERTSAIRDAIESATTWGEFVNLLPEGEWDSLRYSFTQCESCESLDCEAGDCGDDCSAHCDACFDAHRAGDPFDSEDVPGYNDDYPTWLAGAMEEWFPKELVQRYLGSSWSGSFLDIPEEDADQVVEALKAAGHRVTYTPELDLH